MAYVAFAMNVDEPPFFVESFNVPASVFLEFIPGDAFKQQRSSESLQISPPGGIYQGHATP